MKVDEIEQMIKNKIQEDLGQYVGMKMTASVRARMLCQVKNIVYEITKNEVSPLRVVSALCKKDPSIVHIKVTDDTRIDEDNICECMKLFH